VEEFQQQIAHELSESVTALQFMYIDWRN